MAKSKGKTEPRKRRQKQGYLGDMEPPKIDEIEDAAESYVEARNARMQAGETEQELHKDLLALMKTHGINSYEFDGRVITVDATEKVHVRRKKEPKERAGTDATTERPD